MEGIEVVRITEDGSYGYLRSILLRDVNGREVEILGGDSSNRINICVPKPPEFETQYKLAGTITGVSVCHTFTTEQGALDAKVELEESSRTVSLVISEVQVEKE